MMLEELHRPNPTVHVHPSLPHDDSTADMYSPFTRSGVSVSSDGNANGVDFNSPCYPHEALTMLEYYYLPSNETDLDPDSDIFGRESDAPTDAYSCDHFRMFEFKVRRCARGRSHNWIECPYAHPGEKARRRDPRKYHYSDTACPDFRKGYCKKGDACEFAHGVLECWLHPARYRTQSCKDGTSCKRRVCFFAHTPKQVRVLPQQSPRGGGNSLNWAESHDGSPPVSPMSRSLGLGSINEMVASRRNLQLGKVKSFPSSRNVRMGESSGFGYPGSPGFRSPRGSMLRPGFSSLPSTPSRVPSRSGISYLPQQREEALVMQMQMPIKSYLKDSNVGAVSGVVTPTDSNVGVGGVVTPNGTANHELAAKPLLKLRIAALFFKAAHQFMDAKGGWKMNEINTTEEAIPTRYYCYSCCHLVTVDVEVEIKCPFCHDGFIQACGGVNSLYLTMSTESELYESSSDGEALVDEQRHVIRVTPSEWILLLTSCGIEILASAFDQVSSPLNPHYALIGMLLAIVAVLVCICELIQNAIKERVVLRRRGMLWCFHYPPPNNMLFGTFPEFFGLGLAIAQCICSAVKYHFSRRHATSPIKLSPLPVVFAFSLVVSKLVQSRRCTIDDTLQNGTFSVLLRCWLGCITSQPPSVVDSLVTGAVDRVPLLWVRYFGGGLEMDLGLEAADKLRRDKVVAL